MSISVEVYKVGGGIQNVQVDDEMTVGEFKALIDGASLIVRHNGRVLEDADLVPEGQLTATPQGKAGM